MTLCRTSLDVIFMDNTLSLKELLLFSVYSAGQICRINAENMQKGEGLA